MKNILKKMFSVLLVTHEHTRARRMAASLVLTLGLALGAQAAEPVEYRAPVYKTPGDPTSGVASWKNLTTNIYTVVESASAKVTWNAGWYVVTNEVTLAEGAKCAGEVHLILADGAKLTALGGLYQAGIIVSEDANSLAIYGQSAGSGELIATGNKGGAGIGGNPSGSDGQNITINGGIVTAQGGTGNDGGAGIGGGADKAGQNIVINGGTVTAKGGKQAPGIGGGYNGKGLNIRINGGEVKATAGQDCSNAIGDGAEGE